MPSTRSDDGRRYLQLSHVRESIRTGLWFIPTMFLAGAIALAAISAWLDRVVDADASGPLIFTGGPDSAMEVLSAISSTTLAFTGVVFSITIIALQLASGQFSPRVLRTFLRDRGSQVSLGVFTGTFLYSLLVLRTVRLGGEVGPDSFVPSVSVTVALLLVLASLGTFVYFVNHIAQSIRAVSVIEALAEETRAAIDANRPADRASVTVADGRRPVEAPAAVLAFERAPGVVIGVDEAALVDVARRHRCVIRLLPGLGDFVPTGAPLAEIRPDPGAAATHQVDVTARDLLPHIGVGPERTLDQDLTFGLRQLVDIAERALSPGVNDPTTAVQTIDRLHDLLRRLAGRPDPSGLHLDGDGELRLVHAVAGWDDLLGLAFDEIRHYGAGSLQIARRLRAALDDLDTVTADGRRTAVQRQLSLLDAVVARSFHDPEDRRRGAVADQQGLGGA